MDAGCQLPVPSCDDVAAGVSPWTLLALQSHALTRAATDFVRGRLLSATRPVRYRIASTMAVAFWLACAAHAMAAGKEFGPRGELMVYVANEDRRTAVGEFYLLGKYGVMVRPVDVKKGGPLQFILFDQPRKRRQVAEDLAGLKAMLAELPAGAKVDFYDTCTEPLAGSANEAVLSELRDYIDSKGQAGVDYLMCTCLGGINKRPWQHAPIPAAPATAGK